MTTSDGWVFADRELSWLSFNERVLQEALDPSVPIGERLNFLAIFSSNLDEFFRVRVASLRSLLRLKKKRVERLGVRPARTLRQIHRIVGDQQDRFGEVLRSELLPALERAGIALLDEKRLSASDVAWLRAWFSEHVAKRIQPHLLEDDAPPPFLRNGGICLVVELWRHEGSARDDAPVTALVEVPSPPLPRFVILPERENGHAVIFLDDVVRLNLDALFPKREVGGAWAVKLTRDAELYLEDEFAGSLVESIRRSLAKRETGLPCRFLYDVRAPYPMLREMRVRLELDEEDFVVGGRYHNLHDLASFPRFGRDTLSYGELPPQPHPGLEDAPSILAAVGERDRLLHFPYQRFDSVIRLLEEAAADPDVHDIRITLYRIARDSAVARALIEAARNGKRVTAFVEVKARFDEESNLDWAGRMEAAGVRTLYSMPGLKVHAKLLLITRREADADRLYAYLGTGNFNEKTARVYTDLALLTADPELTAEVRTLFDFLAGDIEEPHFQHLMVAPFQLRRRLYQLITNEAMAASENEAAGMILKMNSLEDAKIVARLYEASRAGVPIQLIVRGICTLIPGRPRQSETITARSLVDRFLEHARIFIFENRGDPQYWLASADWMTRNLSRRVEVAFPIRDPLLQPELRTIIGFQLADNQKARVLDEARSNAHIRGGGPVMRAQLATHAHFAALARNARVGATPDTDSPRAAAAAGTVEP
ncbi:MAG: polyphosphate kinase 1 [Gemmatimonadetes bacterium]|nr:polyphosphate kinase 1 [Gemmatimonadota bacterium]